MPVYRDSAVVLRVTKLGEADRIITLLTRRTGKVRAVAKGVRRTKSKFGGRLEPFSHVDLQLYAGRNLDIVTQAETLDPFGATLAADYPRYTCATAIAETAERLTSEEREPSLRLYLLVVSAIRALTEIGPGPDPGPGRLPAPGHGAGRLGARADGSAPGAATPARTPPSTSPPAGAVPGLPIRSSGSAARRPATIELMAALAGGEWAVADAPSPAIGGRRPAWSPR